MMIEAVGKDIDKHKASIPIEPTLSGPYYAKISAVCNEGNHLCGHFSFQVKTASTQIICATITNGVSPSMEGRKVTSVEVPLRHINLLPSS